MKKLSIAVVLAVAPLMASANIIPTGTTITGSGPFVWTYDLKLSSDQNANAGLAPTSNPVPHNNLGFSAFLTLYDFAGYVAGSCGGPAGWTCTAQVTGFTPDDVLPNDLPGVPNITWSYTSGPTLLGQPSGLGLGLFSASSAFNTPALVSYSSRGVKNGGFSAGTIADNVGSTQGPVANAVPTPGTLSLAGMALLAIGSARRRLSGQVPA